MRFVSALLFLALTGSVTLADEAKPADPKPEVSKRKVPLRVVKMLPETHQVLLLDRNRGTHVTAEVGQDVDGYIVDEITDDEVTLVAPNGAEIILTAPDMTWRRRAAERKAAATKAAKPATDASAALAEAAPEDPYADPQPTATAALPAGDVRVASLNGQAAPTPAPVIDGAWAPADPYADPNAGITAFAAAVGAADEPAPAPAKPAAKPGTIDAAGALAAAVTGSPAAPAATSAWLPTFIVARADVDAALADFGATAVTFDARFVADGLRLDAIAKGTILAKAGLEKGDTITAIDGKPLRSFDDAADVYARMQHAKAATIVVQRAGKPVTLKLAIR